MFALRGLAGIGDYKCHTPGSEGIAGTLKQVEDLSKTLDDTTKDEVLSMMKEGKLVVSKAIVMDGKKPKCYIDVDEKTAPPFAKPAAKNSRSSASPNLPPCSDKEIDKVAQNASRLAIEGTADAKLAAGPGPLLVIPLGCAIGLTVSGLNLGDAPGFAGVAAGYMWLKGGTVSAITLGAGIAAYAGCSNGITYLLERLPSSNKKSSSEKKDKKSGIL